MLSTRPGRIAAGFLVLTALAVSAGLVLLWPGSAPRSAAQTPAGAPQSAEVTRLDAGDCEPYAGPGCRVIEFVLRSGPASGRRSFLTFAADPFAPDLRVGDAIRVAPNVPVGSDPAAGDQLPLDDPSAQPFAFVDFERTTSLAYLALAFVAAVVALGRWQGVRSLLALASSLLVVIGFVVPAILDGRPPLLVALVGGMAVMLVTMAVTHGPGLKSSAAILGTTAALVLTALLALAAVELATITGLSSEESRLLATDATSRLSLQGLVIAGIIIGALGVLDDVTISQSSTVLALKRANPSYGFRKLFGEGLAVGRDHLGATINTLVLAYVGASLPVLLIFGTEGTSATAAVNQEPVAEEIVATLVGSLGLVAAVPVTTALAALLASRAPREALADDHAHVHAH